MILDRVTITGADDSVRPSDLVPLTERFPFVEWGILLSRSQEGGLRFPSAQWIEELHGLGGLRLCGHLCGAWVRDLCVGSPTFWLERERISRKFERVQLNFHARQHETADGGAFIEALRRFEPIDGWIFQLDGVNEGLFRLACEAGIRAQGLFDLSGGAGVLPAEWPPTSRGGGGYMGYAGGLSPENLDEQLKRIDLTTVDDARIWIDVETHVRSKDDRRFDLGRAERFLEIAAGWVSK